jgi:asparagine synthase (glutamine-hydrolysing)
MVSAHSVEGRHPFLDAEILDFMTTVPDEHKIKGTNEKYLLKRAAEGIVPDEILKRKKFPFQAPGMSAMTKSSGAEKFLDEAFFEKVRAQGVFDVDQVRRMKELYSSDGFRLMGAYEIDYLLIVLTVTMLCETYHMTL